MFFQSLLPRPEIGANSYLLDLDGVRVILDAGMHPSHEGTAALPNYELVPFDTADAVVISHAHHDHIGTLPVLQRRQPSARVMMTEATLQLGNVMLHNSVNVMCSQREELGIIEYPFFTHREIDELQPRWETCALRRPVEIGGITCEFYDAGHILGSVGALFHTHGETIFYTGDINFDDQSISCAAAFPQEKIGTLIIETTRGNIPRRPGYTRADEAGRLASAIRETMRAGGSVLMPVFALGKTQELLMVLHDLRCRGDIPAVPTFIGGLSLKVAKVYDDLADQSRRQKPGFRLLENLPELQISMRPKKGQPRAPVRYQPRAIFALSSGMMTENTLSNDFAFQLVENPANSLLFVGYVDSKSPAGKLKATPHGAPLTLHQKRAPVALNCRVESFDFSGHSDREAIRRYANQVQPRRILLVHGDAPSLQWFEQTLRSDLPACDVKIAPAGEMVAID
ncbi:MAG: MBL fold metallo-hydrolase [Verrucomicrobiales bacterium]